ncbi:NfeD family protein [Candidatus Manganitrophus noduliformans]|uniref:Nodulation protein NfeD n=1 Tax=Candidatus Manganitrophus noduliformans TaxID=2606439 RepID=A0A7X6DRE4_9BACT|nr:nodulation protein NfeD [Candidatus Manganitrophus noduliformans]NKE71718.1 nodulation protein NfeD [Candidatus Manganitrophus noduliformans]
MRPLRKSLFSLFLSVFFISSFPLISEAKPIHVVTYDGIINPVSSELFTTAITQAEQAGAEALIIQLDTPGGLDTSMRDIIKAMIASEVPIVVYVAPSGGRAGSAGVFITLAAHVAAMAPGTNIGAAHPVAMGGGEMDEEMKKKITNDAAAYIRSLAERRGRNPEWAEKAVRESVSITEQEAVKLNVVDLVADDLEEVIKKIDGRTVTTAAGKQVLSTENAEVVKNPISLRLRILKAISDPNVAYILMLVGITGLIAELYSPGAIFPGVVGAISLILAFYSFQTLPINYAGLLLILLAVGLFIAEALVPSFGILGLGGIAAFLFGSLMLMDTDLPALRISPAVILSTMAMVLLVSLVFIRAAWRAQRGSTVTGKEGMVGEIGVAIADLAPRGMVRIHGEIWQAESDEPVAKGEEVEVTKVTGLKLRVRKIKK